MYEVIGCFLSLIAMLVGAIFAYGKLNAKVEAMDKAAGIIRERQDRELTEIRAALQVLEAKLDAKKLDKEVFAQFAMQVERNTQRNTTEHDGINNKLDQIKDLMMQERS